MIYIRDRGQVSSDGRQLSPSSRYIIGRPRTVDIELFFGDRWQLFNRGQNDTWLERGPERKQIARGETIDILEGDEVWFSDRQQSIRFSYDTDGTLQGTQAQEEETEMQVEIQAEPMKEAIAAINGIDTLFEFAAYVLYIVSELPLPRLIAIAAIATAIALILNFFHLLPFPQQPNKPATDESASMLMLKHQKPRPVTFSDFDRPFESPPLQGLTGDDAGE